ncbi:MAG: cytochrome c3 family protein, partial [Verrucomicrobiota bacterium]
KACLACHKMDLDQANDSHPVVKFRNPENAIFLDKIQATQCIACHTEHQEEHTRDMGVTLPADYCTHCHQVTLENRESHKGLAFNTCATAGCHNYHDNQALFEDFLLAHQSDPDHFEEALLTHHIAYPKPSPDAPSPSPNGASSHPHSGNATLDWAASAHAAAQVNCSDCHNDSSGKWVDQPHPVQSCQSCHDTQVDDFHRGKHGMRLALGLPAMTPKEARRPMHPESFHKDVTCVSCHDSHKTDRSYAAVNACLTCHTDSHSTGYVDSPHHQLWKLEVSGVLPVGSGVSCATCHMPREERRDEVTNEVRVVVQHNQNANLTPNEKMVRSVCNQCHGLQFTLDSLADRSLIDTNFSSPPTTGLVEGIQWAVEEELRKKGAASQ